MDECEYIVFAKVDENGVITAINSSAFVDGIGWTVIDRGAGDKYHHAQGNYLERGLADEGIYNYKLVGGVLTLRSDDEKAPERARVSAAIEISDLKEKLGAATREEYMDKLAERASWRAKINELEAMI